MIHCVPVAEKPRSFCSSGTASATIVWSMNVIDTAKIIATRTSRRLPALVMVTRALYGQPPAIG